MTVKNNTCIYAFKKMDGIWFEYTPQCNHEKKYVSSKKLKADGTDYESNCPYCHRKIVIQTNVDKFVKAMKKVNLLRR